VASYNCTTYPTADARVDDPGFSSAANAIQACPQSQAVCGTQQYIYFNASESNTTTVTISTGLTENTPCTYWVTSDCFAPGFSISAANTMTSAEANVMVTEWGAGQINSSTWYPRWPERDTPYSELDDQEGFMGGQLPFRTQVLQAANATAGTPEMNRTLSGETISDLLIQKTQENSDYYTAFNTYNRRKNEWNASLRIGNSVFNFAESFAFLAPADEADLVYTPPSRPDMPY